MLSIGSRKIRLLAAKPNAKDLAFVINLVDTEKVKPVIDRSYPLSETAAAMKYLSSGHAQGKVIIKVGE